MAINKKLITFNSESVFEAKLKNNEILDTSIVFIKDTGKIWTHGVYFGDRHTEYLLNIKDDFNNTPDGFLVRITDNLTNDRYLDFKSPRLWGHTLTPNTGLTGPLLVSSAAYATTPNKAGCTEYGLGAISHNTQQAIAFDNSGNTTISKILKVSTYIQDSKSVITTTKSSDGIAFNAIKQYDERGAFISSFSNPAYLNIQGAQASTTTWQPWVTAAATDLASWGIGLGDTSFYIGRVAKNETGNKLTQSWKFNSDGLTFTGLTKYITVDSLTNASNKVFTADGGLLDLTEFKPVNSYDLQLSLSQIDYGAEWKTSNEINLSSKLKSGVYLLIIQDNSLYYSGTFSYFNADQYSTIDTDEEIILHACGTKNNTKGIMYAKIKPNASNKAELYLACSKELTKSLTIYIKQLSKL